MAHVTDPVSAAHYYRRTLEQIAHDPNVSDYAATLARQILSAVTVKPPVAGSVTVSTGFGGNTRRGFVTLGLPPDVTAVQISPTEARDIAIHLLEAAEASESDHFFMDFLGARIGLKYEQAGEILLDFRRWREEHTSDAGNENAAQ